ncbi:MULTISPECIES: hypothetical protein [Paeniglutamicibacter]|uniref:Uncharacterized protein n=1 Tax=Paeniglutamicibacter sulfureus TaxID=43666 RepID=A0ABU2BCX1_9MICC|nr:MULTISPECIES: hypothetical protein [Paeniglutamicibacter]MCV9995957.1 hypothetical protein [Paeniglutamicibacter sp. ZC-3]MDR7356455.1 hypothetical protein [Paeniglutamicibacter sulfureus]
MGRRAKSVGSAVRNHSLLGWGAFLSVLLGVASPLLGMSTVASIALAGTLLVVFVMLWLLSATGSSTRH